MKRDTCLWMVAALAAFASGCNHNSDGVSIADWPSKAGTAWCSKVYACCTPQQAGDAGYSSQAECTSTTIQNYANNNYLGAEDAGRIVWDPNAAQNCLTEFAAMTCEQLEDPSSSPPACGSMAAAMVAPGGACDDDDECIDGYCDSSSTGPGTCMAYALEGMSCGNGVLCDSTTYCTPSMVCEPFLGDGSQCDNSLDCASGRCSLVDGGGAACGTESDGGDPLCTCTPSVPATGTCFVLNDGCSSGGGGDLELIALLVFIGLSARRAGSRPQRRDCTDPQSLLERRSRGDDSPH